MPWFDKYTTRERLNSRCNQSVRQSVSVHLLLAAVLSAPYLGVFAPLLRIGCPTPAAFPSHAWLPPSFICLLPSLLSSLYGAHWIHCRPVLSPGTTPPPLTGSNSVTVESIFFRQITDYDLFYSRECYIILRLFVLGSCREKCYRFSWECAFIVFVLNQPGGADNELLHSYLHKKSI